MNPQPANQPASPPRPPAGGSVLAVGFDGLSRYLPSWRAQLLTTREGYRTGGSGTPVSPESK